MLSDIRAEVLMELADRFNDDPDEFSLAFYDLAHWAKIRAGLQAGVVDPAFYFPELVGPEKLEAAVDLAETYIDNALDALLGGAA